LALLLVVWAADACQRAAAGQVTLCLLDPSIASSDLATLERPALGPVLISDDDIMGYEQATHCLLVTDAAWERVMNQQVPVSGTPFALCLDGEPLLVGSLWTPLSSLGFDGVVIMVLIGEQGQLCLERGYPGPTAGADPNPRVDPRLIGALRQRGKLR
jgi:hypothetical protein